MAKRKVVEDVDETTAEEATGAEGLTPEEATGAEGLTPEEVPVEEVEHLDPTKVIKLNTGGHGEYSVVDVPDGWQKDRRVTIHGQNYEHVEDDSDGVWCYRAM